MTSRKEPQTTLAGVRRLFFLFFFNIFCQGVPTRDFAGEKCPHPKM